MVMWACQHHIPINWSYTKVTKNSDTSWTFKGLYTFSFNGTTAGTLMYKGDNYNITKTNQ